MVNAKFHAILHCVISRLMQKAFWADSKSSFAFPFVVHFSPTSKVKSTFKFCLCLKSCDDSFSSLPFHNASLPSNFFSFLAGVLVSSYRVISLRCRILLSFYAELPHILDFIHWLSLKEHRLMFFVSKFYWNRSGSLDFTSLWSKN